MSDMVLRPTPVAHRVSDFVTWYAERTPQAEASVHEADRLTYAALAARVDAVARALLAVGVKKGDRVATLAPPHPDYLITFLASASIGAIWMGLNPRYRTDELTYVVADAEPSVLFARTSFGDRQYDAEIAAMRAAAPSVRQVVALDDTGAAGTESIAAFLARGSTVPDDRLATARADCGGRDACLLVYTSGSTGRPKGALLAHDSIVQFSNGQNRAWPINDQRFLNYFPINHVGCVVDMSVPTLAAGGCLIFMEQFTPDAALALMVRERVSAWASVPTVFQMQLELPDFASYDLSAVRLIIWEGAAMPVEVIRRLRTIVPLMATNYGMTETTSAITIVYPTEDEDVLANSVGSAFEGVQLRLADEHGKAVADGAPGEVQTHSIYNTLGYWRRPDATAAAFTADGWFRTGDLAVQRPDGRYRIVGRIKEMYKSGGYNVYPREVEDCIQSHPDVVMAAVVGCPDPLWQEVGVAFVVGRGALTADALEKHCREHLANYKIPKRFVLCSELPLLPIGKVDKVELARRAQQDATA
ncbi:MAG: class I adenylate-forming enzyme family protein [Gemmatimonadetes bacterium]|nr:class I adenylate-forming enzyme family protein [Gemmatimonadota bacterium]